MYVYRESRYQLVLVIFTSITRLTYDKPFIDKHNLRINHSSYTELVFKADPVHPFQIYVCIMCLDCTLQRLAQTLLHYIYDTILYLRLCEYILRYG